MLESSLQNRQKETFEEVLQCLKQNRYCNMVRPTGFGKTFLLVKTASAAKGFFDVDGIVYVYPRDVIKEAVIRDYQVGHTDILFVSYNTLWNMCKGISTFKGSEIDINKKYLFMFDESHFLGAAKWQQAYRTLEREFPTSYFLGATATPVRTNGVDVTKVFFYGNSISTYTLNEAIKDGMYKKPLYSVGMYNSDKECKAILKEQEGSEWYDLEEKKNYLNNLKIKLKRLQNICNCEHIIKTEIAKVYDEKPTYLKFICFFSRYELLYSQYGEVCKWFKNAYPYMTVNSIIIGNDCAENKDMSRLFKLVKKENTVDLIMCVDKLSYGYHINDLTGIHMFRSTDSEVILNQQIGRALSITSNKKAIIFDWVGNVERVKISEYKMSAIRATGIGNGRGEGLFDSESVEFSNYYKEFEDVMLVFNAKRAQRKSAVFFMLLKGVMPPWVACKELYLSPDELVKLLKDEGAYDTFVKESESKFKDWRGKCT